MQPSSTSGNVLAFQPPDPKISQGSSEEIMSPAQSQSTIHSVSGAELDAKLEAVEARSDARLSRFEERIDQAIGEMRRDRGDLKTEITGLRTELGSFKFQLTALIVGTSVAVVFGVAAFNATLLSNMVASFESGKNTATALTQATEQIKATQAQLDEIQKSLASQTKPRK